MENKKSNKGVIVILIILIIMVLTLGSYIVYDKFFNTENDKKVTENNVKDENKDDIKENDIKETYNAFTEKKLNIKLSNDFSIKFEQDYANDKPAGLIFMTSKDPNLGSSVNIHAPIPGYTTVKSIGAIENSTYKRILVFLTNENDQVNAWYTDIKNDDVSSIIENSDILMGSFKEINVTSKIKSIGILTKENKEYSALECEDGMYLLSDDGSLIKNE